MTTGEGLCAVPSSTILINVMLEVVDQNSATNENHRSLQDISARTFCLCSRPAFCQISKHQPESLPRWVVSECRPARPLWMLDKKAMPELSNVTATIAVGLPK